MNGPKPLLPLARIPTARRVSMKVALVSCVKSKHQEPHAARDLYTSPLFRGMRRYAEGHADAWYILSARHGVLAPDRVIAPYEQTLNHMGSEARRQWADQVNSQLVEVLPNEAEVVVLAGLRYREHVVPFLRSRGHAVTIPLEGLPLGRQLQYLTRSTREERRTLDQPAPTPTRVLAQEEPLLSRLTSRRAVLEAIAECDRLGRDAFLEKYGYGPARTYFLEHDSKRYDSKAIAGVAYGYQFPTEGPLENSQFSGGRNTVQRRLEELGFTFSVLPTTDQPRR